MDDAEIVRELVLLREDMPDRRTIVAATIAAGLATVERMESVPREQQVMARAVRMADQLLAELDKVE